jgi:DNA-binding NarL/FixJ family response regulator
MTAAGPRVLIVNDHQLFRAGVRSELEGLVDIAGDAATVEDAVREIAALAPDVVLLDVHMPDGGGVEVIRRAVAQGDPPRFLALSVSDAAEDVIAVIRAGARGYVTKSISGAELADAVRRVHDGDAVFSPKLAGFVLDAFAGAPPAAPARAAPGDAAGGSDADLDQLTPREREVLRHLARDLEQRLELRAHAGAEELVVVHNQDAGLAHGRSSSVSSTSVPAPGELVMRPRPPCRLIRPTIDSRTPRRSGGSAPGSKPGPRSRTNTCVRESLLSA